MKHLLLSAIVLLSTSAFALDTGSFTISGTVSSILDIIVTQLPDASAFTIVNTETKTVASVVENSNQLNGYKILMYSDNSSKMLLSGNNASYFADYKVSYDGQAAVSLPGVASPLKVRSRALQASNTYTSLINATVTGKANLPTGTYSDIIHIRIESGQ